jgi:pimeloyl-ACP methyl ester carboxylesterase
MFPRPERFRTGDEAAPRAFRSSTPNERKTVKKNANDKTKIAAEGNASASFPFAPSCPVLFLFGGNKPARFHGDAWLKAIDAKKAEGDGSAWYEMNDAGHWFPVERVDETFDALDAWFRATKKKENDVETSDSPTPSEIRSAL